MLLIKATNLFTLCTYGQYVCSQGRIYPGKKGFVAEGQLLISLFSIKPHFLLRL